MFWGVSQWEYFFGFEQDGLFIKLIPFDYLFGRIKPQFQSSSSVGCVRIMFEPNILWTTEMLVKYDLVSL